MGVKHRVARGAGAGIPLYITYPKAKQEKESLSTAGKGERTFFEPRSGGKGGRPTEEKPIDKPAGNRRLSEQHAEGETSKGPRPGSTQAAPENPKVWLFCQGREKDNRPEKRALAALIVQKSGQVT